MASVRHDAQAIQAAPLAHLDATWECILEIHPLYFSSLPQVLAIEVKCPTKATQVGQVCTACPSGAAGSLMGPDGLHEGPHHLLVRVLRMLALRFSRLRHATATAGVETPSQRRGYEQRTSE